MTTPQTIDFNADIGEGYGVWAGPNQIWRADLERGGPIDSIDPPTAVERIMRMVSSVNLACGFHAGDPYLIKRYVAAAKAAGCRVGAHPSYPDLAGFGLRFMDMGDDELKAVIQYQMGALDGFLRMEGMTLSHVKCHGALYNRAGQDERIATTLAEAVAEYREGLPLYGLPFSAMEAAAERVGVPFVREAFSDRAYHANGALVDRRRTDAMVLAPEAVVDRVTRMAAEGVVRSIEGDDVRLDPGTICFHADTPPVLAFLAGARDGIAALGMTIGARAA
ncbi:5-oxoprolinase subunit PxpA [Acuticoccus mangrovi]|uniref:LamB/YcsF family protein n=1 Tax=Acuticoccus mangrovi TaxID=2796142 RepID=A0A934IG34_9HYPH|nr:5-oxoprolinase subunit PxpA [Acuticoccus mangrovi]MBJ3776029.1 LamB/YcsF family protein [Acuticoccus mangrovi]